MKKAFRILAIVILLSIVIAGVSKGITNLPYPLNVLPLIVAIQIAVLSYIFYRWVMRSKHAKKG